MNYARLLLIVFLLGTTGTVSAKPPLEKDRFGFYITANRHWTRIPFQLHSNLIVVPVTVNGSDTLRFILDTGVSNTIITDPKALNLDKLKTTRKVKLTGAGEGAQLMASVAIGNSLSMGALRASHQNLVVLDDGLLKLSEYVGTPVHGIFGYEIFNNFVVSIDFQRREIMITQPKYYRYRKSKGDKYPIYIQDTKCYTDVVSVMAGDKAMPLRVILDTGAGHALLLDRGRSLAVMTMPDKVIRAQLGRGLNGVINGSLGRIEKIRFGRHELTNILASFPDSLAFGMKLINTPDRQGNIGCELLRRFNVTFNYQEKYIVLKPVRRAIRETFEHDMSGLELKAQGKEYRNYMIDRIILNSPAEIAGLREGDELMFINNQATNDLNISDIYKILQRGEGREVTILVRRNGQIVVANFALRRLI